MRWLFYFLAALLAAVAVGTVIGRDPGRVVLIWGGWTVETSVVFSVVAVFISIVLIHFALALIRNLFRLPEFLRRWRGDRGSLRAEERLARGLEHMLAGQWQLAERDFRHWARKGCNPMLGYLFAARAAHGQGAERRRDHFLGLAAEASHDPETLTLVRAELLPDLPAARSELERLVQTKPGIAALPPVRRAQLDAAVRSGAWTEAQRVIAAMKKAGDPGTEDMGELQRRIAAGLLEAGKTEAGVAAAWSELPAALRRDPGLISRYVHRRLQLGPCPECEALLSDALAQHRDPVLVRLFGQVQGANPARQLRIAEGWLKRHGPDADLLLTLGRVAARAGDQDQARAWLEQSLRLRPCPDVHGELGRLLEMRGDPAAALDHYRRGLALINSPQA